MITKIKPVDIIDNEEVKNFYETQDSLFNEIKESIMINGLKSRGKDIKSSEILIVGLSYKKNSSDVRESPALQVIDSLIKHGAVVTVFDSFAKVLNPSKFVFVEVLELSTSLGA